MHPKYKEADAISGEILNVLRETLEEQGEGMLESVYHFHVFKELTLRGFKVASEAQGVLRHKGVTKTGTLYVDTLVNDCFVIALKSVEGSIREVFVRQTLTYMKQLDCPIGMIFNFGATNAKQAKRLILAGADIPDDVNF